MFYVSPKTLISSFTERYVLTIVILVVTVTAMPEDFLCCPSEFRFSYIGPNNSTCWLDDSTPPESLPLKCQKYNIFLKEEFNLTVITSNKLLITEQNSSSPKEFDRGEACFYIPEGIDLREMAEIIAICDAGDVDEDNNVLGYCELVSAVFLLLTMVVYAALPEVRDVQGKSILNFCLSMGIGLALLSNFQLNNISDMTVCAIQGFFMYFFVIASCFWTTAISVQILLNLRGHLLNNYGWKEFCWFALFAWGCPAVLTVCVAIVNFHPGDHIKPGIGLNSCWFYNTTSQLYYMYIVIAILICINISIIIYTFTQLRSSSLSCNDIKKIKYKFGMAFHIFIITGTSWIFEMISSTTKNSGVWYVLDVFNAVQGLLLFLLLVVFRKRVVKALLKCSCLSCANTIAENYLSTAEDDEEGVVHHGNMSTWVFNGTSVE